jgi:hypothetical protein
MFGRLSFNQQHPSVTAIMQMVGKVKRKPRLPQRKSPGRIQELILAWSSACLCLRSADFRPHAQQEEHNAAHIHLFIDGLEAALLQNAGESSWELTASATAVRCEHVTRKCLIDGPGSCTPHRGTATMVARTIGNVSRLSEAHSKLNLRQSFQAWRLLHQVCTVTTWAPHIVICHCCQWSIL